MSLSADDKTTNARYNLANEAEADAEIGEEAAEALKQKQEADSKDIEELKNLLAPNSMSMRFLDIDTSKSMEACQKEIKDTFMPKVLIINHEKRLGIDTTCSNLSIKYQCIYLSAYQLIR